MSDKEYAPLGAACVKALNDKLYEKRKTAAGEIERMVRDFAAVNNTIQIKRLLKVLGQDFCLSQSPHTRKGGLIGLAAMAIGLGKDIDGYVPDLLLPVVVCFRDPDCRVRYYACEALYNVIKVCRGHVLPFFNEVFDALSKLSGDPEQNVRNGSELLDGLLKDIVMESSSFDLVAFIPLIRERIYATNQFSKQFIVSWISVLHSVPDIDMLVFLPDLLDGLFRILEDPSPEIKRMCETVLGEFLSSIIKRPHKVDFVSTINILIIHSKSNDELLQFIAITWIKEFVNLSGRKMLPYTSGILTAVLLGMAYDDNEHRNIRETATSVNNAMMQLVADEDSLRSVSDASSPTSQDKTLENVKVEEGKTDEEVGDSGDRPDVLVQLDMNSLVEVLTLQLCNEFVQTKLAVLRWILHLLIKIPNRIFQHVEEFFPVLLKALSDQSDEVVLQDLEVLSEIASSAVGHQHQCKMDITVPPSVVDQSSSGLNSYFTKFLVSLVSMFSTDNRLLEDRGSFIIRQLCVLLNAESIYRTLAGVLIYEEDAIFASHMSQTLSTILLTSSELFELRMKLKDLKTEDDLGLFRCLYWTWCHNPVATVALCLLTQNYQHAYELIHMFGDVDVTLELLTELDKLVQLLESPIFTFLRLQLLEPDQNKYLVKCLYGLVMLLPQSEAFKLLQHRLQSVPSSYFALIASVKEGRYGLPEDDSGKCFNRPGIDFDELFAHFKAVREKHKHLKRAKQSNLIAEKNRHYL